MQILKKISFKKVVIFCFVNGLIAMSIVLGINYLIINKAEGKIYYSEKETPENTVAVVLGTSRYVTNGNENLYFTYRIEAAAALYLSGKVKKILVSGDNSVANYNEPREMFKALVEKGVCPEDIELDFAGFRTFDSMVRAKEVFGLDNFIVVSQKFHCERAIFIAESKGISATGFAAKDPQSSSKTQLREYPARVSAFLDCTILNTKPHFLGEKINILAEL